LALACNSTDGGTSAALLDDAPPVQQDAGETVDTNAGAPLEDASQPTTPLADPPEPEPKPFEPPQYHPPGDREWVDHGSCWLPVYVTGECVCGVGTVCLRDCWDDPKRGPQASAFCYDAGIP